MNNFIQLTQKSNCFKVFITAKRIRFPFARIPSVIQIEH